MYVRIAALLLAASPVLAALAADAPSTTSPVECPDNVACHVVTLNDEEMKVLAGPNGILQTAAQARSLDLAQFVVYFQNKLKAAPMGTLKTAPAEPGKPAAPAAGSPALGGGTSTPPADAPRPGKKTP